MSSVFSGRAAGLLLVSVLLVSLSCAKGEPNGHSRVARADQETLIEGPDGVLVVVPKGALDADARITVQALPPTRRPGNAVPVADGVRLTPEGQEFKTGVQVTIPISPAGLPPGKTIDDVVVMRAPQDGDAFVPLPTRRMGNAVVAQTEHFSDFVAVVAMDGTPIPCVDTYCSGNETCATCPIDCGLCTAPGTCGNGLCESNESCGTCLYDCNCLTTDGGVVTSPTVIRGDTSLEWTRDVDFGPYDHASAVAVCDGLVANGLSDWRLPTRYETLMILDYSVANPSYGAQFPTLAGATVWTATPSAANPTTASWAVYTSGQLAIESNTSAYSIRCVRDLGAAPTPRTFTLNGDGTVVDSRNGLIWDKDQVPTSGTFNDDTAICTAKTNPPRLWRVPTVVELASLVDDTDTTPPTIDAVFGMPVSGNLWTSTNSGVAQTNWIVSFTDGQTSTALETDSNYVLCVSGP